MYFALVVSTSLTDSHPRKLARTRPFSGVYYGGKVGNDNSCLQYVNLDERQWCAVWEVKRSSVAGSHKTFSCGIKIFSVAARLTTVLSRNEQMKLYKGSDVEDELSIQWTFISESLFLFQMPIAVVPDKSNMSILATVHFIGSRDMKAGPLR